MIGRELVSEWLRHTWVIGRELLVVIGHERVIERELMIGASVSDWALVGDSSWVNGWAWEWLGVSKWLGMSERMITSEWTSRSEWPGVSKWLVIEREWGCRGGCVVVGMCVCMCACTCYDIVFFMSCLNIMLLFALVAWLYSINCCIAAWLSMTLLYCAIVL